MDDSCFVDTAIRRLLGIPAAKPITPKQRAEVLQLDLCRSDIRDCDLIGLRGLSSIQILNLWGNRLLTDAGLKHLRGLTSLRKLNL